MKKIIHFISLWAIVMLNVQLANAQLLGNEWINYSQTYFKIKIGKNGVYRIPQSVLNSNGMGGITGAQFALYREGVQIPIYVSNNGILGTSDYIEFYGAKANGKMDTELYDPVNRQGSDETNIISDTAAYFLTYTSTGGSNHRLSLHQNVMPSNPPAAEPFCVTKVYPNANNRASFSKGESYYTALYYPSLFHSGKFDKGEGISYPTSSDVYLPFAITDTFSPSNASVDVVYSFYSKQNAVPSFYYYNNAFIRDTTISAFALVSQNIPLSESFLTSTGTFRVYSPYGPTNILNAFLRYKRKFNFDNVESLNFNVQGNNQTQLLTLTNLNSLNTNIVVDNVTNNIYHLSANSNVVLNAVGTNRELFFISNPISIASIQPITFKNYTQAINQGSYLILADNEFINISGGGITQYKNYRSSIDGGNFNVVVISANELYDQFGWGYDYHPLSIKRFLKYASGLASWTNKPEYMFIVGKGLSYHHVDYYMKNRATLTFPIVPTFGDPGSDNLFAEIGNTSVPNIAIGRLSATTNADIENYLIKVKAYELAQKVPAFPNLENSLWKKTALHVAGSTDDANQITFYNSLNACKSILEDTLIGGIVHTTTKNASSITESSSALMDSITEKGLQYISYYGHATSSGFDYNLNNPERVNSYPRFPIFMAFGCDVANVFEPTSSKKISERYLAEPQGGAIAMVASTNLGWIGYLEPYMQGLYRKMAKDDYGKTFGKQYLNNLANMANFNPGVFTQIHIQNFLLQGDPGISVFSPDKPDYFVDSSVVSATPNQLNTSMDTFKIDAKIYNLGKAIKDSIAVLLTKRKDGSSAILYADTIKLTVLNAKTLTFKVPVDKINDVGLFHYTISVNPQHVPAELTYVNNETVLDLYIGAKALVPTYPSEFAIVNQQNIQLIATTLSPFGGSAEFVMEVDTTEYFNSPLKTSQTVTGTGGVIKWQMPITMTDSTVYYWRTAADTTISGRKYWTNSSFIYLANATSKGWNQSHFFQYQKDSLKLLQLKEPNRIFEGLDYYKTFNIQARTFGSYGYEGNIYLNNELLGYGSCVASALSSQAILFVVIDNITGRPLKNVNQFPGAVPVCAADRSQQFEFLVTDTLSRKRIMAFLDAVPNEHYIAIKSANWQNVTNRASAQDWANDQTYWGAGISLSHKLQSLGFNNIYDIDSTYPYVGVTQKGNPSFPTTLKVGSSEGELMSLQQDLLFRIPSASMKSTVVGPASQWQQLLWKTTSTLDAHPNNDKTSVGVWGLHSPNDVGDSLFRTINMDTSLATISATQYPYLRLVWYAQDSTTLTLPQLKYWRVLHQELPEAALNPRLAMEYEDTVDAGDPMSFRFAIENLTTVPMDSMKVRFRIVNLNTNTTTIINPAKFKPLTSHDTAMVGIYNLNSNLYVGSNILYVEANPADGQQPEQYHPNNLGFIQFVVDDGTLPVKLLSFDAYKRGETALLEWITTAEQNNNGFAIEKSGDGEQWKKIGFVYSKATGGNSSMKLNYDFTDKTPFVGINYYRLKQTDFDGKYEYSIVRTLRFDNGSNINLHPNPAKTFIEISGLNGDESVVIFDALGRKIRESKVAQSSININLDDLSEGTYMVNILSADGQTRASKKVVKLK